jgi:hypothetical protein
MSKLFQEFTPTNSTYRNVLLPSVCRLQYIVKITTANYVKMLSPCQNTIQIKAVKAYGIYVGMSPAGFYVTLLGQVRQEG